MTLEMRARLLTLGLTQEKQAERVGLSRTYFNGLVNGRYRLTKRAAKKIAAATKLETSEVKELLGRHR